MIIRLLIACDVRLYREGLAATLNGRAGVQVIGTAANVGDALRAAVELDPDLLLLDKGLTGGRVLIGTLQARSPRLKVVALGIAEEPNAVFRCAETGAVAYVPCDASVEHLVATLEAVVRGEVLCSPRIAASLFQRLAVLNGQNPPQIELDAITEREREILALIDHGLSNKEIARRLHLKVATVKNHVHHILEKLGVNRRAAAAALLRNDARSADRSQPIDRSSTALV